MARVQDIQISDASLKAQYISYFLEGNYSAMLNLIANNPQLDYKAFVANIMNDVATILSTLQNNYQTNVPDYLAVLTTEFDTRVGQFKDFDEWDSSVEYSLYNFVTYTASGVRNVYICVKVPPVGTAPTNTTYWRKLSIQGIQGPSGENLAFRYAWDSGEVYYPQDVVVYDNVVWGCVVQNSNQTPQSGSTYWRSIYSPQQVVYPFSAQEPTNMEAGFLWFKIKEN